MSDQATQPETNPADGATPTQLQLSDLLVCVQAIQIAGSRGAFRAEEFTQIGATFDRVTAFLRENGLLKPAGETAEQSSAE
jgi:hypothetical protein